MPQFPVEWHQREIEYMDASGRGFIKRFLNAEWTLVCVFSLSYCWKYTSIEVHRKSTAEDFSISGILKCKNGGRVLWEKKFSQLIKTGSSIKDILNINEDYFSDSWMIGEVNICEIQHTNLADGESKENIQLKSLGELSEDLERLLDPGSSSFADVTLKCDGVSIPAHKIILSARSPVFAAMFANPMKESRQNEVDISDIDAPVLRALLMYMYTGKTSDLTVSSAADLLFAADKYQLQDLKTVCSYFLKDGMSVQSMWGILVLGDMHSEDLKSLAVDYICNKCGEFSALENTQEWKALRKKRPDLAMDLLESMVKYRDEKLKR